MTTLVLQTAGQVLGSMVGGPFGEIVGRAVGSLAGAAIDNAVFGGGTRTITGPRLSEMDGLVAREGQPMPRLYGRVRVGGQLIWATRFEEELVTTVRKARGAKGGGGQKVREETYSYFANLAIAIGQGPISFVRRIWADGRELDLSAITHRVHRGDDAQMPDPLIVAKEGAADAPAYRGTAYAVFERLPLADYGNRVPQFAFEVVRVQQGGLPAMIRAVNLIPGASEFAYEPARVLADGDLGTGRPENRQQLQAESDVLASLDQLQALCPNLATVNLVVSWFGDDLRAGQCKVEPRIDNPVKTTPGRPWQVAGLTRASATLTTQIDGRAAYGGTPNDASVIALIAELKRRGLKVALYPFIMMDVAPGNALPNPYGGAGQPAFPWRGRITCHPAPGVAGSVDATAAAGQQVAAFVGTVTPADITVSHGAIACAKPDEWSYRRHILHHARLAEAAGGVDAFIIGTELVGLTRVRSAPGVYPFVQALVAIAADVRAMLGPGVRLTYAADWTEHGAHVLAGGAEVRFPLDPLWASSAIDAVGIDWYPPISDWRDGLVHLDAAEARGPHDPAYLARRQRAGEGFDWFYADAAGRAAQQRLPISDGLGKPWVFRPKDLARWWSEPHVERVGGVELSQPTAWQPGSKPVWLTEIGCPAVDKGANSPNIFPDLRSSEGGVPAFSTGRRDDLMQARALAAQIGVLDPASPWFDAAANPPRAGGGRMIAAGDIAVWAWDARPFPAFPRRGDVWGDGANWATGHWLNGRLEAQPLDGLIEAVLADYGLPPPASLAVDALVDGYVIDRPMSAREALEPLMRLFGLDARFSPDGLVVTGRDARAPLPVAPDDLVLTENAAPFEQVRGQESELPREVRVIHLDSDDDHRRAVSRSRRLGGASRREMAIEAAVAMPVAEADRIAEERLREAWIGRDGISFALGPRALAYEVGDHVSLPVDGADRLFRITRIADAETRAVTAVAAAAQGWVAARAPERPVRPGAPAQAGRPFAVLMDLPLAREAEPPLLVAAATASPWPGPLTVLSAGAGEPFEPIATITRPALIGRLVGPLAPGPLWRWDRHGVLDVRFAQGLPQSVTDIAALAGANSFAVQTTDGRWEIVSGASVALVAPRQCRITGLLRGLAGSGEQALIGAGAGALVVALDEALVPVERALGVIGRPLEVRIAPPGVDLADPSVLALSQTVAALALRPLSPVHPRARRMAGGVKLSWIRRTRRDGDSWDLAESPLAEAREAYRVSVLNGATPVWTAEVGVPEALFPATAETSAFGAAQAMLSVEIRQLSDSVGPGAPLLAGVAVA